MRGLLGGLAVAVLFMLLALLAAAFGAVGVALIGSLLHRWFDLTQWQGSLIALVIAAGLATLIYRVAGTPVTTPSWDPNWEDDEEDDEEELEVVEPPIVPWRRSRPAQGELPSEKIGKSKGQSGSTKR